MLRKKLWRNMSLLAWLWSIEENVGRIVSWSRSLRYWEMGMELVIPVPAMLIANMCSNSRVVVVVRLWKGGPGGGPGMRIRSRALMSFLVERHNANISIVVENDIIALGLCIKNQSSYLYADGNNLLVVASYIYIFLICMSFFSSHLFIYLFYLFVSSFSVLFPSTSFYILVRLYKWYLIHEN